MTGNSDAEASARACREFYDALTRERFGSSQAVAIVAAWMGRPIPTDVASLNAVMQNFADTLENRFDQP